MENNASVEQFLAELIGEEHDDAKRQSVDDFASRMVLSALVRNSHMGYMAVDRATGGKVKYNRVRDICKGLKAPAKIGEAIAISHACSQDPVEVFYRITALEEATAALLLNELDEESKNNYRQTYADLTEFDPVERQRLKLPTLTEAMTRRMTGESIVVGSFGREGRTYTFSARIRMEE